MPSVRRSASAVGRRRPPRSARASRCTRSAIMSIAVSRSSVLPLGAVRAPVADLGLARRAGRPAARWREPFGHSRPREIGRVRVALDLDDLLVLARRPAGRSRPRSRGRPSARPDRRRRCGARGARERAGARPPGPRASRSPRSWRSSGIDRGRPGTDIPRYSPPGSLGVASPGGPCAGPARRRRRARCAASSGGGPHSSHAPSSVRRIEPWSRSLPIAVRDRRTARPDELGDHPVRERQRQHGHPGGRDLPPPVGEMPEEDHESLLDADDVADGEVEGEPARPGRARSTIVAGHLRPARDLEREARVEHRQPHVLERLPAWPRAGIDACSPDRAGPGPQDVADAEQLGAGDLADHDLAQQQAVDDQQAEMGLQLGRVGLEVPGAPAGTRRTAR